MASPRRRFPSSSRPQQPYNKPAKTFDQQIQLLIDRGVIISDMAKAEEYLSDIGYYRLGFYLFPFEVSYPNLNHRSHIVIDGTRIEDIVALYYFDMDLRNIFSRYLSRIEVSIRTTMIYELSKKYIGDSTWFVNPDVVKSEFIRNFDEKVYSHIRVREPIRRHHRKYRGDYAPAWKTMEFMTFGNLEVLFDSLLRNDDKLMICRHYNEPAPGTFKSYMMAIRDTRNACAHGNVLFDLTLSDGIRTGAACATFTGNEHQTFKGAYKVIRFLLNQVSQNRCHDMVKDVREATLRLYEKVPGLRPVIEHKTGIIAVAPSNKITSNRRRSKRKKLLKKKSKK